MPFGFPDKFAYQFTNDPLQDFEAALLELIDREAAGTLALNNTQGRQFSPGYRQSVDPGACQVKHSSSRCRQTLGWRA